MDGPYSDELEAFRRTVRTFFAKELAPRLPEFEAHGLDRSFWRAAGRAGILGTVIPEAFGGAGANGLAAMIISEELGRSPEAAMTGSSLNSDVLTSALVAHGTAEQKQRWFPGILSGDLIQALAVTEPQAGSDVTLLRATAVRDGGVYVISGSKSMITNGAKADLIYAVVRVPADTGSALTMIAVPGDSAGVTRRRTRTAAFRACDTGEIYFDDVRVPLENRIGAEGQALRIFRSIMSTDRLQMAAWSLGAAESAFDITLDYARTRKIFGQRLIDLQNTQFVLAEVETDLAVGRAFLHGMIHRLEQGTLAGDDGAAAKIWLPEMEGRVLDKCLQLWGGSGMMEGMPIARLYAASRVQRIYAGATELMKTQLARKYLPA